MRVFILEGYGKAGRRHVCSYVATEAPRTLAWSLLCSLGQRSGGQGGKA